MHRYLLLTPAFIASAISTALLFAASFGSLSAQEIMYEEDSQAQRWVASASIGFLSPFGPDQYSIEWNGRHSFMATIEYYPDVHASFGAYASHAMFDHTGMSETGPARCMAGIVRGQTGAGLTGRVYPVRWNGLRMTLGGKFGAVNVTRERPLVNQRGDAYGKVDMLSSLDLDIGASVGIEATIAPRTSVGFEFGYECVENQITLNQSLLARTSLRVGID